MSCERKIVVWAHGMDDADFDALFDRVADAAHDRDELVSCSAQPVSDVRLIVRLGVLLGVALTVVAVLLGGLGSLITWLVTS